MGRMKGRAEARVLAALLPAEADGLIGISNAVGRKILVVREFDFFNSSARAANSGCSFQEMPPLRGWGLFWFWLLQICRAYGAGFAGGRPANPTAGNFRNVA